MQLASVPGLGSFCWKRKHHQCHLSAWTPCQMQSYLMNLIALVTQILVISQLNYSNTLYMRLSFKKVHKFQLRLCLRVRISVVVIQTTNSYLQPIHHIGIENLKVSLCTTPKILLSNPSVKVIKLSVEHIAIVAAIILE